MHRPEASLLAGLGACAVCLITPGPSQMGRSRSTSLALPPPSTSNGLRPLCLPGQDFRCSGLPGGSTRSCGKPVEGPQSSTQRTFQTFGYAQLSDTGGP